MPTSTPDPGTPGQLPPSSGEPLVLFGAGSAATTLCSQLRHGSDHEVVAFTVDRENCEEDELLGLPVAAFDEIADRYPPDEFCMMVAISFREVNRVRADCFQRAKGKGYRLLNYVSSDAVTGPDVVIGENCRIGSNCVIQPFTTLGDNVSVGDGSIIGHHSVVGDHCFIASGSTLGGEVEIGPYAFLGTGSIVRSSIRIARETVVGAGALILENTAERSVYMASPAEPLPVSSRDLPLR
jgi:sugar O-acyltransferase (sialic acid O-acetyltransferase NeuD family)